MNSHVTTIRRALDPDAHEALLAALTLEAERDAAISTVNFFEHENERLRAALEASAPDALEAIDA